MCSLSLNVHLCVFFVSFISFCYITDKLFFNTSWSEDLLMTSFLTFVNEKIIVLLILKDTITPCRILLDNPLLVLQNYVQVSYSLLCFWWKLYGYSYSFSPVYKCNILRINNLYIYFFLLQAVLNIISLALIFYQSEHRIPSWCFLCACLEFFLESMSREFSWNL